MSVAGVGDLNFTDVSIEMMVVTEGCIVVCKRCSGCKVVAVGLGCCSL